VFDPDWYSFTVNEEAPIGTLVGSVSATDPQAQALTFGLDDPLGGNVPFATDSGGNITVSGPLDYETQNSYSLRATVTDPDGNQDVATVLIAIGTVQLEEVGAIAWEGGTLDFFIRATPITGTISSVEIDLDRDGNFDVSSTEYDPVYGGFAILDVDLLYLLGSPVDDGVYPADMRITTDDGSATNFVIDVAVGNLPPDAEITDPYNVDEGQPFVLSVATSDPGPDTVTSIVVDWGDGTQDSISGSSANVSHTYGSSAIYEINITVTDEDGTWTTTTHALVGIVDPPPPPPDSPYVASAYATDLGDGTMQLDLTQVVPFEGNVETIFWDLDGDGVFDDAFGATVLLTAEPGDAYFADVQITDSGGYVGEGAFTFFVAGGVEVQATKNNYRKLFVDATPVMKDLDPKEWPVHHWYEQKPGLTERLRKKLGINVHAKENLVALPKDIHYEITKRQGDWWRKTAKEKFRGNIWRAYREVDLNEFKTWANQMNAEYADYMITAGHDASRTGRPVQIMKNLRKIGGVEGFRLTSARRIKKLGLAPPGGIGLLDVGENLKFGINIYNHPPAAVAALNRFISSYEAAVDEAMGPAGRVKYNTGAHLKDNFINYMKAMEVPEKVVTSVSGLMEYQLGKLSP
jgi:hypothetical protein